MTAQLIGARPRVMVVDDAATVRMYHRDILERAGFEVDEAVDGVDALERCAAEHALFIIDVNMPCMDGYTLVRSLRRGEATSGVPIIMISTEAGAEDRDLGLAAGANLYLVKPVRAEELALNARLLTALRFERPVP